MIEERFVEVPRQRNTREENASIKAGEPPKGWQDEPNKLRQKNVDARWTKKNDEKRYGYKNHVNADAANKLVQSYAVSDATVHDSQVFVALLDQTVDAEDKKRPVYADSAYRSKEREERLAADGFESQIYEKGTRDHPLTDEQKASNRVKSKTRVRVERVFGAQHAMVGILCAPSVWAGGRVKIGMMNLVYNMRRLGQLLKCEVQAANARGGHDRRGGSAVA